MTLINNGYRLDVYRELYNDPSFLVLPPMASLLEADETLLPPAPVKDQAGRPKKGPRQRKRLQSNGEYNTSSKYNEPMSASYGPLPNQGGGAGPPRNAGQTKLHGDRSGGGYCSEYPAQGPAPHGVGLTLPNSRDIVNWVGVTPELYSSVGGMSQTSSQGQPSSSAATIDLS